MNDQAKIQKLELLLEAMTKLATAAVSQGELSPESHMYDKGRYRSKFRGFKERLDQLVEEKEQLLTLWSKKWETFPQSESSILL